MFQLFAHWLSSGSRAPPGGGAWISSLSRAAPVCQWFNWFFGLTLRSNRPKVIHRRSAGGRKSLVCQVTSHEPLGRFSVLLATWWAAAQSAGRSGRRTVAHRAPPAGRAVNTGETDTVQRPGCAWRSSPPRSSSAASYLRRYNRWSGVSGLSPPP